MKKQGTKKQLLIMRPSCDEASANRSDPGVWQQLKGIFDEPHPQPVSILSCQLLPGATRAL